MFKYKGNAESSPKKIILCFDGTWNTPDKGFAPANQGNSTGSISVEGESSTNVSLFYDALAEDQNQLSWYDDGVGTGGNWFDKIIGGSTGAGLDEKIIDGYTFLAKNYKPEDSIYILGFSRGAYTARSLVGLIRNCGLLVYKVDDNDFDGHVKEAYSLYRERSGTADDPNAVMFKNKFCINPNIHFLGVWDTVGALGIPLPSFDLFDKGCYEFHDTELSGIVLNAFHAIAIDENRPTFKPTLWDPTFKPGQSMEQVWFVGSHANVGGGYNDHKLSNIPLDWMMTKAEQLELSFNQADRLAIQEDMDFSAPPNDSFKEFMDGAYQLVNERYFRQIGFTSKGNETLADSVLNRYRGATDYRITNPLSPAIQDFLSESLNPKK